MPILIGPLLWHEPKNCCYKIKEDKSFIEDEDVNEEMHWKNLTKWSASWCTSQKNKKSWVQIAQ